MSKQKTRYVNVDCGYGPREDWQKAKVIRTEMAKSLFDSSLKETLLVQLSSGETFWVDYWTDIDLTCF